MKLKMFKTEDPALLEERVNQFSTDHLVLSINCTTSVVEMKIPICTIVHTAYITYEEIENKQYLK